MDDVGVGDTDLKQRPGPVGGLRIEFRAGVDGGERVADRPLGDGLLVALQARTPDDRLVAKLRPVARSMRVGRGDALDNS